MLLAFTPYGDFKTSGKGVRYGNTHAVQATRERIGATRILFEFTARVQLCENELNGGNPLFFVNAHWNTTTVIGYRDGTVGVQYHFNT